MLTRILHNSYQQQHNHKLSISNLTFYEQLPFFFAKQKSLTFRLSLFAESLFRMTHVYIQVISV